MGKNIVDPALVLCDKTKKVTSNAADESNFEIYRELTVDSNGKSNIFCNDQPFLFSGDYKPYINIKGFPWCESKYYGTAVKSLMEFTENEQIEAINNGNSEERILALGREFATLKTAYDSYLDQTQLTQKSYPCILQIVDRWFEVNKKTKVNNYFDHSQGIKEHLKDINDSFLQVAIKAKKKLKDAQPNIVERMGNALSQLRIQLEDLEVYKNRTLSFTYKGFSRFDKAWNEKDTLAWFDNRIEELREVLKVCSDMLYEEIFFADMREYVSSCFEAARKLFFNFYDAMKELEYEDDLGFNDSMDELKGYIEKLEIEPTLFSEEEGREFLDNNSFLVCRCGGVIKIVYDGQDFKDNLETIYPNLVELLKVIEKDLYSRIFQDNTDELYWAIPVSWIDGFNFIRHILLGLETNSGYKQYVTAIMDNKEVIGFGAEMKITIRPRSVINKKKHNKAAAQNLADIALGLVLGLIPGGAYASVVMAGAKVAAEPNVENTVAASAEVADTFGKKAVKVVGNAVGTILDVKTAVEAIGNLSYYSTADYVGEIKVALKVGTHDITYTMGYDINGKQLDSTITTAKHLKSKVYRHNGGQVSALIWDPRNYDNTIKVDCMTIVDGEKKEETYEYSANGDTNEK